MQQKRPSPFPRRVVFMYPMAESVLANDASPEEVVATDERVRANLARLLQARLVHESTLGVWVHPVLIAVIVFIAWSGAPHNLLVAWAGFVVLSTALRGAWLVMASRGSFADRTVRTGVRVTVTLLALVWGVGGALVLPIVPFDDRGGVVIPAFAQGERYQDRQRDRRQKSAQAQRIGCQGRERAGDDPGEYDQDERAGLERHDRQDECAADAPYECEERDGHAHAGAYRAVGERPAGRHDEPGSAQRRRQHHEPRPRHQQVVRGARPGDENNDGDQDGMHPNAERALMHETRLQQPREIRAYALVGRDDLLGAGVVGQYGFGHGVHEYDTSRKRTRALLLHWSGAPRALSSGLPDSAPVAQVDRAAAF